MPRSKVSAFIVSFNEAENIVDCVESVSFCDEILVIDSFSTDNTVELATQCGAKVVQHPWEGYRGQKAFGLSLASHEWVINLDADERISPKLREEILEILQQDGEGKREVADGYYLNRVVFFLGRWWRSGGWYPEYRLRFFRKSKAVWGGAEPHEKVEVSGRTERLVGEVEHYTYKDIEDQISRLQKFAKISADDAFSKGKRFSLASLLGNPLLRFFKFFIVKRGYREGTAGFVVGVLEGYYTFLKYVRLWELGANFKPRPDKNESSK